jgi:hypothetical protein
LITIAAAMLAPGLMLASSVEAETIDTATTWNHTSGITPLGEPNTATYGQTFTVGADTVLQDFTFYLKSISSPDAVDFAGYVMAWNGTRATGGVLFESAPQTFAGPTNIFTPVTINAGGLQLQSGQQYVAFFSASKFFDGSTGLATMGSSTGYAGGSFVYYNNGSNFSLLTTNTKWDFTGDSLTDAAFTMHLTAAAAADPLPAAPLPNAAWGGLALMGVFGLSRLRRRKTSLL